MDQPTPPREEIRFAVVLYGGVSLAIYINGVTRELFNLARATADDRRAPGDAPIGPLTDIERVYRRLADEIECRFVVDIISGTSAGGINGVALAKALATGKDMAPLSRLWIEEGDIGKLIHDKESTAGTELDKPRAPDALLNGDRLTLKMCEAFDAMDAADPVAPPLADEIDLYVTATDLAGLPLPLGLADPRIAERRYRQVFHFVYAAARASGEDRDDFERQNNPLLAFTARCTSAFPFAFAPMSLDGLKMLPRYRGRGGDACFENDAARWRSFFRDYDQAEFRSRWFADGGYLDNKPFSYCTETLTRRRSDGRVTRKLIYVEPDPEDIGFDTKAKPNAIDNVVAAAFTLPHAETIREDIERIAARNRVLERVATAVHGVEREIRYQQPTITNGVRYSDADLKTMVSSKGVSYGAYHRLKIGALTDDLTSLLLQLNRETDSGETFRTWRNHVREWRDRHYVLHRNGAQAHTQNRMLVELDLSYRLRRLSFVRGKIDELYPYRKQADKEPFTHLDRDGHIARAFNGEPEKQAQFDAELLRLRRLLSDEYTKLRRTGRQLRRPEALVDETMSDSTLTEWDKRRVAVKKIAATVGDAVQRHLPADVVLERIDEFAKALQAALAYWTFPAADTMKRELHVVDPLPEGFDGVAAARWCVAHYYNSFDDYDLVTFPIQYGTDVGEAAKVDVLRVSPLDAQGLSKQSRAKLAGTSFGHFGAFLDRGWRENDLMWGRLDAAEILIHHLLADDPKRAESYILEAQRAIVAETLPPLERQRLFAAMLEHIFGNSASSAARLEELRERIEKEDISDRLKRFLAVCLDVTDGALLDHLGADYTVDRQLDLDASARNLARAATVAGKVLDGVADDYENRPTAYLAAQLARGGRILWLLVETASPKTIGSYIGVPLIHLAYVVTIVLFAGGAIFDESPLIRIGLQGLAVTIVADATRRVVRRLLTRRLHWIHVKRFATAWLAILAIYGAFSIGTSARSWFETARQRLGWAAASTTNSGALHE